MPRRKSKQQVGRPTDREMVILRELWSRGPGTAREIHEALAAAGTARAFSTTGRFLQIMTAKGLVERTGERPHLFGAAVPQEKMQQQLIADLLQAAFDGRPAALVAALTATSLTRDDLAEIRRVLDDYAAWLADKDAPAPDRTGPVYGG